MFCRDLKNFKEFFLTYDFKENKIEEADGKPFFCGECLINEEGETVGEGENFVNVGFKLKGACSKLLSNLFPYRFKFLGKNVSSIEAVLQSLKFKDKRTQNLVLKYFGTDANNIKFASDYDWREMKILYWQGKPIDRLSQEYQDFIVKLYVSAIQNPLYCGVIKNTHKTIIHSIGENDRDKTVLSRFEFERMLNALNKFLSQKNKDDSNFKKASPTDRRAGGGEKN